jgi:hypothetical protein
VKYPAEIQAASLSHKGSGIANSQLRWCPASNQMLPGYGNMEPVSETKSKIARRLGCRPDRPGKWQVIYPIVQMQHDLVALNHE